MSKALLKEFTDQLDRTLQRTEKMPAGDVRANINRIAEKVLADIMSASSQFDRCQGKGETYNNLLDRVEKGIEQIKNCLPRTVEQ